MTRILFALFALTLFTIQPAMAALIETTAREAIVLDYETGRVLLEKNADQKMPTSSMSKVMTMYVVFDLIKKGQLTMDQEFTVSEKAWRMQGSKMFVELGKTVKVSDLARGVIVQSGNDATIVLAEGIAGTEEAFADMMNKKAQELGMVNSHFMNASGWPDPDHYSTARDLSILARAMIRDFPDEYKIYSEKEFTYHGIKQGNRNPLLYKNMGADGLKTGHTEDAGYGLIGTGTNGNRRTVIVVNGLASMNDRAAESAKLLDWGMKNFENKTLFKAGQAIDKAKVVMGEQETVPLVIKDDVYVTIPKTAASNYKVTVNYKEPFEAPVKKGQQVGTLSIDIPQGEKITVPLYAGKDVERLGFFAGALIKALMMVGGT